MDNSELLLQRYRSVAALVDDCDLCFVVFVSACSGSPTAPNPRAAFRSLPYKSVGLVCLARILRCCGRGWFGECLHCCMGAHGAPGTRWPGSSLLEGLRADVLDGEHLLDRYCLRAGGAVSAGS